MKKHLLLIPSLVALAATPFISLTSCFESEEDDPKPGPTPPKEHKVKVDPSSDTNNISISCPTITLNEDLIIEYHMKNQSKQVNFYDSWISIDSEIYYFDDEYNNFFYDDSKIMIPFDYITAYDITVCLVSENLPANTMTVYFNRYTTNPNLSYSTDGSNWTPVVQSGEEITLNGDQLWLRGNNPGGLSFIDDEDEYIYTNIQLKGNIHLQGNCMDLIDGNTTTDKIDTIPNEACFYKLFYGSTGLKSIPSNYLPARVLSKECYYCMFQDCSWLSFLPDNLFSVNAELAVSCFEEMFYGCVRLTSLPNHFLPFTELNKWSCDSMFLNCYWLASLPKDLFSTITEIQDCSCQSMFAGCGRIVSLPDGFLPQAELTWGCYQYMFANCGLLSSLPANFLPETDNLPMFCYYQMFDGCMSLKIRQDGQEDPDKKIFSCPAGLEEVLAVESMFANTGGEFTGTPQPGHTYYWHE